jgi:hypothetical protein
MKKNLLSGFLILFLLSATSFAGFAAPKNESEKPAATNPRENKLSDEELSRLSKRAEIDNLSSPDFSNKEKNDSRNNLKASNQEYRHHHHGYYYGGGVLLLVILIIVLI